MRLYWQACSGMSQSTVHQVRIECSSSTWNLKLCRCRCRHYPARDENARHAELEFHSQSRTLLVAHVGHDKKSIASIVVVKLGAHCGYRKPANVLQPFPTTAALTDFGLQVSDFKLIPYRCWRCYKLLMTGYGSTKSVRWLPIVHQRLSTSTSSPPNQISSLSRSESVVYFRRTVLFFHPFFDPVWWCMNYLWMTTLSRKSLPYTKKRIPLPSEKREIRREEFEKRRDRSRRSHAANDTASAPSRSWILSSVLSMPSGYLQSIASSYS